MPINTCTAGNHTHKFYLYARTARDPKAAHQKPIRDYAFATVDEAKAFVVAFIRKHAPDQNPEAAWETIEHGQSIYKRPLGLTLNFSRYDTTL